METPLVILVSVLSTLGAVGLVTAIVVAFKKIKGKVDVEVFANIEKDIFNSIAVSEKDVRDRVDNVERELSGQIDEVRRLIDSRCDKLYSRNMEIEMALGNLKREVELRSGGDSSKKQLLKS